MIRKLDPAKKARFLQAALKLFVAQGVQNTSTAEIAREAGAAAGTLFLYFPTKQDLIHELVLNTGREQAAAIKGLLAANLSVKETFHEIWCSSVGWFLDHLDAYQYVRQVRDSGMISASVVQESAALFDFYYTTIAAGLAEGLVKPYPIDLIGGFLYAGIVATTDFIRGQGDRTDRAALIEMGFEIFWDGIKAAAGD